MNVEYGCSHYLGIDLEKGNKRYLFFYVQLVFMLLVFLSNGDIFICPDVERRKRIYTRKY
ncbi:MAG: hypothetical protein L6V81_00080 [Clostridium sp.]|nr:MAG: hypothetical protein L6V81_00080 [Clostridium sp.]